MPLRSIRQRRILGGHEKRVFQMAAAGGHSVFEGTEEDKHTMDRVIKKLFFLTLIALSMLPLVSCSLFSLVPGAESSETTEPAHTSRPTTYTVRYSADGQSGSLEVAAGESFTLPIVKKNGYTFGGYYAGGVQVTDGTGHKLISYTLTSDITVTAKYTRLPSDADKNGEYLGNPGELYYKSASFGHKMARNPWDMALYHGKLYIGGGYYGGSWISSPPIYTYDTTTGECNKE